MKSVRPETTRQRSQLRASWATGRRQVEALSLALGLQFWAKSDGFRCLGRGEASPGAEKSLKRHGCGQAEGRGPRARWGDELTVNLLLSEERLYWWSELSVRYVLGTNQLPAFVESALKSMRLHEKALVAISKHVKRPVGQLHVGSEAAPELPELEMLDVQGRL